MSTYRPLGARNGVDVVKYESVEFVSYAPRYVHAGSDDDIQEAAIPLTESYLSKWIPRIISLSKWILTALIGIVTAYIAVLISICTSGILTWKFDTQQALLGTFLSIFTAYLLKAQETKGNRPLFISVFFLVVCNVIFVGIGSSLTTYLAPSSAGSGIPEIKSTLNGIHVKQWMSKETLISKVIGVILSVSGGLPVGKEGPMIHSGAIVGAFLSSFRSIKWCGSRTISFLKEKDVRDLVTCGAAAGVAAAFGAPIGGVLFAVEEGASFLSPHLVWRAFFCAMVATFVVVSTSISSFSETAKKSSLFAFGTMADTSIDHAAYLPWELLVFVMIGAAGGIIGATFTQINKFTMFNVEVTTLPRHYRVLYVIGISTLLSIIWFYLSWALGVCHPIPPAIRSTEKSILTTHLVQFQCRQGQYNDLASLFLTPHDTALKQLLHLQNNFAAPPTFSSPSLIVFATIYMLGTAMIFCASITSGVFVPIILVGAALGRVVGGWVHANDETFVNVGTYALVGAAAVLGGVTRMTISLTVILLEATGDLQYALPLMMTLMSARWVGNMLSEGLYDTHIHCRQLPFLDWNPPRNTEYQPVTSIMRLVDGDLHRFGKRERVGTLLAALEHQPRQMCWAVVEQQLDPHTRAHENVLEGTIQRHVLVSLLHEKSTWNPFNVSDRKLDSNDKQVLTDDTANDEIPFLDSKKFSQADRECFINLELYVNPSPVIINVEATAGQAYRQFRSLGLSFMCVVTRRGELVGVIRREELHKFLMDSRTFVGDGLGSIA